MPRRRGRPSSTGLPQWVNRKTAKGKHYYSFRHPDIVGQWPLPRDPNSPAFHQAYADCLERLAGSKTTETGTAAPGTLLALILVYKQSPNYRTEISPRTRADYDKILTYLADNHGPLMVRSMPRQFVMGLRDTLAETHHVRFANYTVQVLSILMSFAVDHGWRTDHPALRIKKLRGGTGSDVWTILQLQKLRRASDLPFQRLVAGAIFTGLRQGDLIDLTWNEVKGGYITTTVNKTSRKDDRKTVSIRIHPLFQKILDQMRRESRSLVVFTTETGRPWTGRWVRDRMRHFKAAAGLQGEKVTFHGLGKFAIAELLNSGCTTDDQPLCRKGC